MSEKTSRICPQRPGELKGNVRESCHASSQTEDGSLNLRGRFDMDLGTLADQKCREAGETVLFFETH